MEKETTPEEEKVITNLWVAPRTIALDVIDKLDLYESTEKAISEVTGTYSRQLESLVSMFVYQMLKEQEIYPLKAVEKTA